MEGFVEYLIEEYSVLERLLVEDSDMRERASRLKRRQELREQMDAIYRDTGEKYPTYSVALCCPLGSDFDVSKELEKELFCIFDPICIDKFITNSCFIIAYGLTYKEIPYEAVKTLGMEECYSKADCNECIREANAEVAYLADCIVITSPADWVTQDIMERGRLLGKRVIVLDC